MSRSGGVRHDCPVFFHNAIHRNCEKKIDTSEKHFNFESLNAMSRPEISLGAALGDGRKKSEKENASLQVRHSLFGKRKNPLGKHTEQHNS